MSTISLNRIQYLFSKYFIENWKRDLSNFLIMFIIAGFSGYQHDFFLSSFFILIFAFFYAGGVFGLLNHKPKGMNYLLIPASTAEKTIVNLILVNIYYLSALFFSYMAGIIFGNLLDSFVHNYSFTWDFVKKAISFDYTTILLLLLCESILIFGSVYFKRKTAILKTFLYLFCFGLLIMIVDSSLVYFFTENHSIALSTNNFYLEKSITAENGFFNQYGTLLFTVSSIFFILFFWVLSFLRLKETEV